MYKHDKFEGVQSADVDKKYQKQRSQHMTRYGIQSHNNVKFPLKWHCGRQSKNKPPSDVSARVSTRRSRKMHLPKFTCRLPSPGNIKNRASPSHQYKIIPHTHPVQTARARRSARLAAFAVLAFEPRVSTSSFCCWKVSVSTATPYWGNPED